MSNFKKCLSNELERLERSSYDYRYLINNISVALSNVCIHLKGDSKIELELKELSRRINKLPLTSVFSNANRFDNYVNETEASEIRNEAIFLLEQLINIE